MAALKEKNLQPIEGQETLQLFRDPQYEQELIVFVDARKDEDYQDWHILRRVGNMGLASLKSGEYWLGMTLLRKAKERNPVIKRLTDAFRKFRPNVLTNQVSGGTPQ